MPETTFYDMDDLDCKINYRFIQPPQIAYLITTVDGSGNANTTPATLGTCVGASLPRNCRPSEYFYTFSLGAVGAIAAVLTAAPTLCVQLWDAVAAGEHQRALALHEKLLRIWNAIFDDNLPANVKYAMELQGRAAGQPRPPMSPSSESQQIEIPSHRPMICMQPGYFWTRVQHHPDQIGKDQVP